MNAASTQAEVQVLTQELPEAEPAQSGRAAGSLLDAVLAATSSAEPANATLDRFLSEPAPALALSEWLGGLPALAGPDLARHIVQRLNRDIARIDALLNRQVNAILHHPDFQKLEASWRGLRRLVDQLPDGDNIQIKVLNVSWKELTRDLTVLAVEFDHSNLFRKVYSEEFGMPGGIPYGVLLGDYEIRHRMTKEHPYNDLETLNAISEVAAAAFAPFIAAAHPSLLELDSFAELERFGDVERFADIDRSLKLSRTFEQPDYLKWKAFRKKEDSRFVGLTMPRVLVRLPYQDDSARVDGFRFREETDGPDASKYLWGNAAYAFASVLIRAFAESSWLADIRGVRQNELGGGLVEGLPSHSFSTDKTGIAPKCSTDAVIAYSQEQELSALGFIPLCHCQDTEYSAFYGNQSVQEPQTYDQAAATANARLSAMLQYILCASRFAHYLKVMGRDRIGSFTSAGEIQDYWRRWLMKYTNATDTATPAQKAKHPLRDAKVEVVEVPDKPGSYICRFYLRPHFQLDQLTATLRLNSTLAAQRPIS